MRPRTTAVVLAAVTAAALASVVGGGSAHAGGTAHDPPGRRTPGRCSGHARRRLDRASAAEAPDRSSATAPLSRRSTTASTSASRPRRTFRPAGSRTTTRCSACATPGRRSWSGCATPGRSARRRSETCHTGRTSTSAGGQQCDVRVGGAWGTLPSHPHWVGFYSCAHGSVYGPASGDGIDRDHAGRPRVAQRHRTRGKAACDGVLAAPPLSTPSHRRQRGTVRRHARPEVQRLPDSPAPLSYRVVVTPARVRSRAVARAAAASSSSAFRGFRRAPANDETASVRVAAGALEPPGAADPPVDEHRRQHQAVVAVPEHVVVGVGDEAVARPSGRSRTARRRTPAAGGRRAARRAAAAGRATSAYARPSGPVAPGRGRAARAGRRPGAARAPTTRRRRAGSPGRTT